MSDPSSLANGRYLLVKRLGEGGMASVFLAFDQRLQVWRAVKILLPEYARKKGIVSRFETEAQMMALLEHPHIVRVYDVGQDGDAPYIVMELVEGGSLVDWLEKHGPMPARLAIDVTIEMCQALQFAHDKGVIHRDVKPHNVMIDRKGSCRVADFGIARINDGDLSTTKTGAVMGTWGFMAPEQRTDAKHVDNRADVYAIAASLYALLTNDQPTDLYLADHDDAMLAGVPDALKPVMTHATEYRKEKRYPSAMAFAEALIEVREQLPPDPFDTPPLVGEIAPLPPPPSGGTALGTSFSPTPRPAGATEAEGERYTILPDPEADAPGPVAAPPPARPPAAEPAKGAVFTPPTALTPPEAPHANFPVRMAVLVGLLLLSAVAAALVALLLFNPKTTPEPLAPAPTPVVEVAAPAPEAVPVPQDEPELPASPTPSGAKPTRPAAKPTPAVKTPTAPVAPAPSPAPASPPAPAAQAATQCYKGVSVPSTIQFGTPLPVIANLCHDADVTVYYRSDPNGRWFSLKLGKVLGSYRGTIPTQNAASAKLEWYLSSEGVTHGSAQRPYTARVAGAEDGSADHAP